MTKVAVLYQLTEGQSQLEDRALGIPSCEQHTKINTVEKLSNITVRGYLPNEYKCNNYIHMLCVDLVISQHSYFCTIFYSYDQAEAEAEYIRYAKMLAQCLPVANVSTQWNEIWSRSKQNYTRLWLHKVPVRQERVAGKHLYVILPGCTDWETMVTNMIVVKGKNELDAMKRAGKDVVMRITSTLNLPVSCKSLQETCSDKDLVFSLERMRTNELSLYMESSSRCQECGKVQVQNNSIKLSKCGKCECAWYCSRECQVKNWKDHKQLCSEISQHFT